MNREDLKIEIVPLSGIACLDRPAGQLPQLSSGSDHKHGHSNNRKNTKLEYNSDELFEARHMFQTSSGRTVVAFERGPSELIAKKRLIRLLL